MSDLGVDEVVQVGGEAFEGEVRVFGQYVCCQVIVVVFDVQQEKIGKCLCSKCGRNKLEIGLEKAQMKLNPLKNIPQKIITLLVLP